MADKMEMFMRAEDVTSGLLEIPSQNPELVQEDKGNSFPESRTYESQSQGALNFELQTNGSG